MENTELYCFGDLPVSELMDSDNIVEHSGIKGMKWGVRRYQNPDGTLTAAGKKRYNQELSKVRAAEKTLKNKQATKAKLDQLEERKRAVAEGEQEFETVAGRTRGEPKSESKTKSPTKAKEPSIKDMTNEEIQAKIDRINLENRLKDLMKEPVSTPATTKKAGKGKEIATEIMTNAAKNIGTQTVALLAGAAVNKVLKSVFDDPDMTINPKKGQKDK